MLFTWFIIKAGRFWATARDPIFMMAQANELFASIRIPEGRKLLFFFSFFFFFFKSDWVLHLDTVKDDSLVGL